MNPGIVLPVPRTVSTVLHNPVLLVSRASLSDRRENASLVRKTVLPVMMPIHVLNVVSDMLSRLMGPASSV